MSFLIQSTKEHLENTGEIALAAELARTSGLTKLRFAVRTWNGALLSMFGLLVMGRSTYEDIAVERLPSGSRKVAAFRSRPLPLHARVVAKPVLTGTFKLERSCFHDAQRPDCSKSERYSRKLCPLSSSQVRREALRPDQSPSMGYYGVTAFHCLY